MNYKSPINLIISEAMHQIHEQEEREIVKAVHSIGVDVDEYELLRALQYDRDQYQKGYDDRDAEIVRCKDCKHQLEYRTGSCPYYTTVGSVAPDDWFCADGKRR